MLTVYVKLQLESIGKYRKLVKNTSYFTFVEFVRTIELVTSTAVE